MQQGCAMGRACSTALQRWPATEGGYIGSLESTPWLGVLTACIRHSWWHAGFGEVQSLNPRVLNGALLEGHARGWLVGGSGMAKLLDGVWSVVEAASWLLQRGGTI